MNVRKLQLDAVAAAMIAALACVGCHRQDSPEANAPAGASTAAAGEAAQSATAPAGGAANKPGPSGPLAEGLQRAAALRASVQPAHWLAEANGLLYGAVPRAIEGLSADTSAEIAAGDRAMARADFDTAAACFRRAGDLDANSLDALKGLAIALTAANRHEGALEINRKILQRCPGDRTALFNTAMSLSRIGRLGEAEELFTRLVTEHEDFMEARYNLATLYQLQGKLVEAREAWSQVITRWPQLTYPHTKLGEVFLDLGDPNAAACAFADAAKLNPGEVACWLNLAAAAVESGGLGQAMAALKRASGLNCRDPRIWAQMGEVLLELYHQTSDPKFIDQALDAWGKSLALDGDQDDVRAYIERFKKKPAASSHPSNASGPDSVPAR